jgi:hypothetical protein
MTRVTGNTKGAALAAPLLRLLHKDSILEGGNGTVFMTLYLDLNQWDAGNLESLGA